MTWWKVADVVMKIIETVIIIFAVAAVMYDANRRYTDMIREHEEKEAELARKWQGGTKK